MFIELTDHLRCPADHDEAYLVVVPDRMDGRQVVEGVIGCPICLREFRITARIADFGAGSPATASCSLSAAAALALLGLDGPGGFVALIGSAAALAPAVAEGLPGIHLVLVNPPADAPVVPDVSIIRGARMPLKTRSMRGVVLPAEFGRQADWLDAAIGCVLPGLRVVGEGTAPARDDLATLAEAGGWWVGRRGSGGGAGGPEGHGGSARY